MRFSISRLECVLVDMSQGDRQIQIRVVCELAVVGASMPKSCIPSIAPKRPGYVSMQRDVALIGDSGKQHPT
jgi:hypothetical protein